MSRQPIAILLLSVPFNFAVVLSRATVKLLSNFLSMFVEAFIQLLFIVHFRKNFLQWTISGILKTMMLLFIVCGLIALWIKGIYLSWYNEHPILSLAFMGLEFIVSVFFLSKSIALIPSKAKESLKEMIITGLKDFASALLTIFAIVSLIGIFNMNGVPNEADPYFEFMLNVAVDVMASAIISPFHIVLLIFPWRYYLFYKEMHGLSTYNKFKLALEHFIEGIKDLPFLAMFLVLSIATTKKMIKLIRIHRLSRSSIFHNFIKLLLLIVTVVLIILVFISFVRLFALMSTFSTRKGNNRQKKKEIEYLREICNHSLDTLMFPVLAIASLLVIIPYYRLKYMKCNFDDFFSNSRYYRGIALSIGSQIVIELYDLYHVCLFLLCLIFIWRSIPFILSKKAKDWRIGVKQLCKDCLLDILGIFLLILITATLYRIRLIFQKRKLFANKHFCYLAIAVFKEIYEDILILPYIAIMVLTPWRLVYTFSLIFSTNNLKQQRIHIKRDGLRPIEDYLTLVFSVILLLSVWRTAEIASIVITHIRQVINGEHVTSSLFRKVFRKFVQLLVDFMMLFIICLVFVMMIEIPNLFRRLKMFLILYKQRRGIILFHYIKSLFPKPKQSVAKKSVVDKLNKNVFYAITNYLDIESIGNIAQANKKLHELTNFAPIWKSQYEQHWKQHLPESSVKEIEWEDNYKKLAVEGFLSYKEQNRMVNLSEEERDYRMGARAIIIEEFIMSLFRFPHMLVLPLKLVTYLLLKIDFKAYFATPRYAWLQYKMYVAYNMTVDYVSTQIVYSLELDVPNSSQFHKIQLYFPYTVAMLLLIIVEQFAFILCTLDFFLLRIFSFGTAISLHQLVTNQNPPKYKMLAYILQLVLLAAVVISKIFLLVSPYLIAWHFNPSFAELWYTIYNISFLLLFAILWTNIATILVYLPHFPYFRPHYTLKYMFKLTKVAIVMFGCFALKIYRIILKLRPSGRLFNCYGKILEISGNYLKRWGIMGDLIYSPLVIIWIFWPISIPFIFNNWNYFIPVLPVTVFLLIKGYSIAKTTWSDSKKNN